MCESEGAARYKASKVAEDEFLDYIASYRRRYNSLYARGPLLLLTPENEDGRMVSVVSLVVPSRVPHPQLLLMQDAARVLSDMITYTPPQPPPSLPTRVRSPAVVVKAQEGSGAECALVVASVLLGAGYHAPLSRDQHNPHLSPEILLTYPARTSSISRRQVDYEARVNSSGDYTEAHLHFWVVVLPPGRGVTTPTFIESTTGQVLSLSSSLALPYLYIHALFNHTNYWACTKYNQAISCDMFDLSDRSVWMPLMDDGVGAAKASQAPHHPTHQDNKNQNNQQYSHHTPPSHSREKVGDSQYITTSSLMASGTKHALKVPTTWATPIIITEEALIERFPGGWREEVYSGVVVRHYSPFSHPRGATLIFTFFSKSGSVKEVWEKYEQREDGLVSCHRPTSRHHRGDLCQHQEGHTQT
ncbi:Dynein regulatory complex subunit 7-like 4 [Homarus americanus]|uniref:Dynein regulatory complex subunit 7-like 4 n=1 Tax=Homarus americanus TaxID=6706 RepID=A0A8J5JV09_HOMAM|nr:Dynein regulatory complex subunit 7-like 4 [Homarus americanus]